MHIVFAIIKHNIEKQGGEKYTPIYLMEYSKPANRDKKKHNLKLHITILIDIIDILQLFCLHHVPRAGLNGQSTLGRLHFLQSCTYNKSIFDIVCVKKIIFLDI